MTSVESCGCVCVCVCASPGLGSDKAWRLLQQDSTPFRLYLAVTILTPIERLLGWHFQWQNNISWLAPLMKDVPVVVMGNMARSPAVHAMNQLVGFLFSSEFDIEQTSDLMKCFLDIPSG